MKHTDFPIFLGLCAFSATVIYMFVRKYYSDTDLAFDEDIEMEGDQKTRIRHERGL